MRFKLSLTVNECKPLLLVQPGQLRLRPFDAFGNQITRGGDDIVFSLKSAQGGRVANLVRRCRLNR